MSKGKLQELRVCYCKQLDTQTDEQNHIKDWTCTELTAQEHFHRESIVFPTMGTSKNQISKGMNLNPDSGKEGREGQWYK